VSLRNMFIALAVAVAALIFLPKTTHSLDFVDLVEYTEQGGKVTKWLALAGGIKPGDGARVVNILKSNPDVKGIWFGSPGGVLDDALEIAEYVYSKKLSVVVPPKTNCSSGCALVFMASPEKLMHFTSAIGLHRAFEMRLDENGEPVKDDKGQIIKRETEATKAINLVILMKMERWGAPIRVLEKWITTDPINGDGMYFINSIEAYRYKLGIKILMDPEGQLPLKKVNLAP
jgi:hypothetical protein